MEQQSKRLFIALPFQREVIEALSEVKKMLQHNDAVLKIVPPQQYHLTLKFLGSVPFGRAEKMAEDFVRFMQSEETPVFSIRGLGAFPSLKKAQVVWAGIKEKNGRLESLQRCVEDFCGTYGFDREKRPFRPHLTLARVRRDRSISEDLRQYLTQNGDTRYIESFFNKLVLYSSILRPQGPLYEEIKTITLNQE